MIYNGNKTNQSGVDINMKVLQTSYNDGSDDCYVIELLPIIVEVNMSQDKE